MRFKCTANYLSLPLLFTFAHYPVFCLNTIIKNHSAGVYPAQCLYRLVTTRWCPHVTSASIWVKSFTASVRNRPKSCTLSLLACASFAYACVCNHALAGVRDQIRSDHTIVLFYTMKCMTSCVWYSMHAEWTIADSAKSTSGGSLQRIGVKSCVSFILLAALDAAITVSWSIFIHL